MTRGMWALIAAGFFASLALLLLGPVTSSINALIQTGAFRHELETRASVAAGGTVEIGQIRFGFLRGIQLVGLASKLSRPEGTITSQVESVDCSFSWLALLQRQLKFNGVTLERPQIVLTQEPPSRVPLPATAKSPANESNRSAPPTSFVLESAGIADGRLSIRDSTGSTKADLQGITVHADTSGYLAHQQVSGKLAIDTVALPQNLTLTGFTTPFTYSAGSMTADPLKASAFGGTIDGSYQIVADGTPSALTVNGRDIDIAKITQAAKPGTASPLAGTLSVQSRWLGVEAGRLNGEGDAQIAHGKLSGIPALHELAGLLQTPALSDPDLAGAKVHFRVADGTTHFSALAIESPVFSLTGEGTINPQGAIDAHLRLTLHAGAMGTLGGVAAMLVQHGGSIPLHISGSVSDPHTNLGAGILNPTPGLENAVSRLFH